MEAYRKVQAGSNPSADQPLTESVELSSLRGERIENGLGWADKVKMG